jgi:hypothetical protein
MGTMWVNMGYIRYPMAFALLVVVLLAGWTAMRLFRRGATPDLRTKAWLDAVLFWGGFAMVAGILGTLVGIMIAAQSIEAAGDVSTTLVWGGIKVALSTSAFGALILGFAGLLWFVLQLRWRLLRAGLAEGST